MKTNTILRLIFSILFASAMVGLLYVGWGLLRGKMEVVKMYRTEEAQSNSLEFGNQLRQKSEALDQQHARIEGSFIRSDQLLGFIQRLENSAQTHDLAILIEKVEQDEPEILPSGSLNVTSVTFAIQMRGEYENTLEFIREILGYEIQLAAESTSFHRQTGEDSVGYSTRMTLTGNMVSR